MNIDLIYTWNALPNLLLGAAVTLKVAFGSMALSLAFGLTLTIFRSSGRKLATVLVEAYMSYVRGTPLLVQILIVYYMLPQIGLDLRPVPAGIFALGLSSAAFTSEIMRAGISAIPKGQIEAANALGLRGPAIWIKVILPQLYLLILPPIVNEFTLVIKGTTLVSVITVVELMRVAQQIYNENFRPMEVLIGVAIIFFVINFSLARVAAYLERRNFVKLA